MLWLASSVVTRRGGLEIDFVSWKRTSAGPTVQFAPTNVQLAATNVRLATIPE